MTAPKPQRRTIRFAIVAVVCLLLGAVTTVGVAWWLPQWTARFASPTESLLGADAARIGWPESAPNDWPPPREVETYRYTGIKGQTARSRTTGQIGTGTPPVEWRSWTRVRRGWPFYALVFELCDPPGLDPTRLPAMDRWSFVSWQQGFCTKIPFASTSGWVSGGRYVWYPCMPVFPGFALDTALYAAAWYLLIFTPLPLIRAGRRRFRVSRGMCGSCGYDLNASNNRPCPECGADAGAKA